MRGMLARRRKVFLARGCGSAWQLWALAISIVVLLSACSMLRPSASSRPSPSPTATPVNANDVIRRENEHPGSTNWIIPSGELATTEIQAYASATSVSPGEAINFFVSTVTSGSAVGVEIYRLGWYGGDGGRLLYSDMLVGQAQGYYDPEHEVLVNCGSCSVDQATGLVEANWSPSLTLTVPTNWVTGVYYAKFVASDGKQTFVQFDVRGSPTSTYVVSTSDTTYEAYNDWGGFSLYSASPSATIARATEVSFDRPISGPGWTQGLPYEIDAIRWMERAGYDVSYVSSIDLDEHPQLLLTHKAYINLGHDEYWSRPMRDGIQNARDMGIGLAFLGANDGYWQIRFRPDSLGVIDRDIICYKVANTDPLYGKQNDLVTVTWRDPLIGRPENALIGIMYSSWSKGIGFGWRVSPTASSPFLNGTSLAPGATYGCDYVGYEWDRVFNNGQTPSGLHILASSHVVAHDGSVDVSNSTYYVAPSGALVFATGSIYWSFALDDYRMFSVAGCSEASHAQPEMGRLLASIMDALAIRHIL